ncbi:MAG: hypothetical protein JWM80_1917 [Cyanobacteria bacterium RYN_339]|nr:hypothetical protein [Cyanobacteria bacterium RYN_339]
MVRMINLDGVHIALEVDKVEFDLRGSGLQPATSYADESHYGERWQPIMSFHDGSTLLMHCPSEEGMLGYKVVGPRPHKWSITVLPGTETVARLAWEAA